MVELLFNSIVDELSIDIGKIYPSSTVIAEAIAKISTSFGFRCTNFNEGMMLGS